MTQEPPPTQVDDIVVRGQRRWPNGQFPVRSGEGYGEPPEGPIPIEIGPEPDPPTSTDPCASPETALDWNADAAAAEALRRMEQKARDNGEPDFGAREYGTAIYLMPDGTFRIGTIQEGVGMSGSVMIDYDEYGEQYLIATIHSHPSSGGFSQDRPVLDYTRSVSIHGDAVRLYGVRPAHQGANVNYEIIYYDESNIDAAGVTPEVNPEGSPCPGVNIL